MDRKKIRAKEINANTFFAVIDYVTEGPKTHTYPEYCKINHILQKRKHFLIKSKSTTKLTSSTITWGSAQL